ncbi:MAG: Hsp20 family protein [Candidatus Gastranaerophilaceae bacterium]
MQLQDEIDIDKTEAKLEHGVLKIIAPKMNKEKEQTKKLIVK